MFDNELITEEMARNKEFFTNNVHINRPLNDPRRDPKIIVKLKETGLMIALDRWKDFNPKFHERIIVKPQEIEQSQEIESGVKDAPARWEELKAKGWSKLQVTERVEYQELKKIFDV